MDAVEEAMDVVLGEHGHIVKGKRTKRPLRFSVTTSSSSDEPTSSSPAMVATVARSENDEYTTDEDEDMANCLILLAKSGSRPMRSDPPDAVGTPSITNLVRKRTPELYECKTCGKCFSSFQALGGHRASHKKPKVGEEKGKKTAAIGGDESLGVKEVQTEMLAMAVPVGVVGGVVKSPSTSGKGKVHECSICGSEFTSGQALGGHMRRHRIVSESRETEKPKGSFSLDLNLPAPAEETETAFEFTKLQPGSVFQAKRPISFCCLGGLPQLS